MSAQAPEFTYVCSPASHPNSNHGVLSGLRLAVKDLFHISGIPTGAGNPDWLAGHEIPEQTASSVATLLAAGANLVGKTLTDEIAYSLNGVNAHYGTPINPAAPDRLPGGSSSGSAVAVANGSADIGLGTDTGGSIRVPASYNGLYGFRPSHGLIPTDEMVALAPRFDTVGWLCRDLPTLLTVAATYGAPFSRESSSLQSSLDDSTALRKMTLCHIVDSPVWQQAIQTWMPIFGDQMDSVELIAIQADKLSQASEAFRVLQGREIWRQHGEWITTTQPRFAPDIEERLRWCQGLSDEDERDAEQSAQTFLSYWQSTVLPTPEHVALLPTTPGAAPRLDITANDLADYRTTLMGLTAPAGLSRAPQLSLPWLQEPSAFEEPFAFEEPSAGGNKSSAGGKEPSADGKEPSAGGKEPSADGEELSADDKKPSAPWGVSLMASRGQDEALLQLASRLDPLISTN